MAFLAVVLSHKLLLFFIAATSAFAIATIVLGVNNADLRTEIEDLNSVTGNPTIASSPSTVPTIVPTPSTVSTQSPIVTTSAAPPSTLPPINISMYRLPRDVIPSEYRIYLHPNLNTGQFNGIVTITGKVENQTNQVIVNSHTLTVTKVIVNAEECKFQNDTRFERLIIQRTDGGLFQPGPIQILIEYEGDLTGRIVGFYMSSYDNEKGEKRTIATSKFEPTYARQAFPSFDEPNFKAQYTVELVRPTGDNYIALSNYDIENEIPIQGTSNTLVTFKKSVAMSTYLSCFIVADFQSKNSTFQNRNRTTDLRVYATPDQLDKTDYALRVANNVIEYYVDYFQMDYPLPKLDLVAIPDFVSGAMEHWGLVTFRETALLYSPETHSASNKQRVAAVIAHELAHSWFGNLVTMDWWDDLWLNEGFASYIEFKGINAAEPTWNVLDIFTIDTMHSVLSLDATQESHPIIKDVITPDSITEVFDSISYNKGASILRMLEYVVTPAKFQQGVTNYLKAKEFSNAITQDLLDELKKVTQDSPQLDLDSFMATFTRQMGYPILTIRKNGTHYILQQKRFLKDYTTAANSTPSEFNYKWDVPVSCRYKSSTGNVTDAEIVWFKHDQNELHIPIPQGVEWLKFNPDQVGYYRVNYDVSDWPILLAKTMELTAVDRAHLLEESFSLAESGDVDYTIPLGLTKYLGDEQEYVAWSVASSKLQQIGRYLSNSVQYSNFQKYVIGLLEKSYDNLGWNDNNRTSHSEQLAQVVILNLACVMEMDDALAQASTRFEGWVEDPVKNFVSPNLRSIVYKYGIVSVNKETWEIVLDRYQKESDASEKLKIINALANVRIPSLLQRLIDVASLEDESYVRKQDYFTVLQYIAANPVGTPLVWDYVRNNWLKLVGRFGLNERNLGRLIPGITGSFATQIKYREMEVFFQDYPDAGAGAAARKQAQETIQNNIKWLETHLNIVEKWIASVN